MGIKKIAQVLCLSITVIFVLSSCINGKSKSPLQVSKWNNYYEGKNIHFYYEDYKNTSIEELNRSYQLNSKVGNSGDELDRATKIIQWMNTVMKYDNGSVSTKEDSLAILKEIENTKKASSREFSIVFSQAATSVGINARRGEFRVKEAASTSGDDYYKVCEIWSDKYGKWVLFDPSKGVYITKNNVPLSAMEVVELGVDSIEVKGADNPKKYLNMLESFLYSYSIPIDNSIYGKKKSNTYITFVKSGELPELRMKQGFIPSTIFVNKRDLFDVSPKLEYSNEKNDKLPTIVIMKKSIQTSQNDNSTFVVGVSINSAMVDSYYLKIDNETWKKVNTYTDMTLKSGTNTIQLSLDGSTVIREIVIEKRE